MLCLFDPIMAERKQTLVERVMALYESDKECLTDDSTDLYLKRELRSTSSEVPHQYVGLFKAGEVVDRGRVQEPIPPSVMPLLPLSVQAKFADILTRAMTTMGETEGLIPEGVPINDSCVVNGGEAYVALNHPNNEVRKAYFFKCEERRLQMAIASLHMTEAILKKHAEEQQQAV